MGREDQCRASQPVLEIEIKKKNLSFKTKGKEKLRNVDLLRGETFFQGEVKKL